MDNAEVAARFEELADLLEAQGENWFKVRAYRRAAGTIRDLAEPIAAVAASGRLRDLPGIGEAIADKIQEYIATGRIARLEEARANAPRKTEG